MPRMISRVKFGRRAAKDARDHKYLIRDALPRARAGVNARYWNDNGWWGDQGYTPKCVGYSSAHWLEDGPVTHGGKPPILHPNIIYREAQKVDEWPGTNYDGTSVRAAAKVMKARKLIVEYRWGFDLNSLIQAVLQVGPVVVGTNWYEGMMDTDSKGFVHVKGAAVGGHAYVINGVSVPQRKFRIKNSWGRRWGLKGRAWISFDDMARLIREDGEVMLAVESEDLIAGRIKQLMAVSVISEQLKRRRRMRRR